jgi:hypothetical protein
MQFADHVLENPALSVVFSTQSEVRDNLHGFSPVFTQLARTKTCSMQNQHIISLSFNFQGR